jgi:hypothetical protein
MKLKINLITIDYNNYIIKAFKKIKFIKSILIL